MGLEPIQSNKQIDIYVNTLLRYPTWKSTLPVNSFLARDTMVRLDLMKYRKDMQCSVAMSTRGDCIEATPCG